MATTIDREYPLVEGSLRRFDGGNIPRLKEIKARRDNAAVQRSLAALTQCARTGEGNLLALSIEAAKVRATLGENHSPVSV